MGKKNKNRRKEPQSTLMGKKNKKRRKEPKSGDVIIFEPNGGSAVGIYNACRELLWGMVEYLSQSEPALWSKEEISDLDNSDQDFDVPVEFTSSKMKRRNNEQNRIQFIIPPYADLNVLIEENVYKILYNNHLSFVRVLGVGPCTCEGREEYAIVKHLMGKREEVLRSPEVILASIISSHSLH